jgi:hypothetical protein
MRCHVAVEIYKGQVFSNNSMLAIFFDDVHRSIFLEYLDQVKNAAVIFFACRSTT